MPEVPTIYRQPKFQAGSPNGRLKLMILRLTFTEQTTKFPAHSALLKQQQKMFDRRPDRQENIYWNYPWDRYAIHFSKFVAFCILLWTRNDTLRGFFYHLFSIFYASQFFAVCFVVTLILEGSQKHSSFWKWFTAAIQYHISF